MKSVVGEEPFAYGRYAHYISVFILTPNAWRYTNCFYWKQYEDFNWIESAREMIQWPICDTVCIKDITTISSTDEKLVTSYIYIYTYTDAYSYNKPNVLF